MAVTKNRINQIKAAGLNHLWMHNRDWIKTGEYGGPDIIVDANGVEVIDIEGNSWIDVNGGYSSVNVGYGRTEVADAVKEQMLRIPYFPQGTTTIPAIRLAEKLASILPGNLERSWLVSGGSEANETAVKIARSYHNRVGENGRYKVISRRGSYHGATAGVLWMGSGVDRVDYEPSPPGMLYAPQPNSYRCEFGSRTEEECAVRCAEAVERMILFHGPETIAAFIGEPISASALAAVPGDIYWPMLREICQKYGVLLIADEVITGFGRTGKMFASDHWDLVPDLMTVAKGITSSYVPMAAAIAKREVADVFSGPENIFRQALTSGGHPISAAAALANIEIIESDKLVENSAKMGSYFKDKLMDLKVDHPIMGDVRGLGLLLGVELVKNHVTKEKFPEEFRLGEKLTEQFRNNRLILSGNDKGVSLSPPLCVKQNEIETIVDRLDKAFTAIEVEMSD